MTGHKRIRHESRYISKVVASSKRGAKRDVHVDAQWNRYDASCMKSGNHPHQGRKISHRRMTRKIHYRRRIRDVLICQDRRSKLRQNFRVRPDISTRHHTIITDCRSEIRPSGIVLLDLRFPTKVESFV